MAQGDIKWFNQALLDLGSAIHNLGSNTLNYGIIKSAANGGIDPLTTTAAPHWGGTGTTNLSTSQVVTTGTSYTGPAALPATVTWTSIPPATLRAGIITLAQDASGFTNGRWLIIYNATNAAKQALCFVDLGSDRSLVTGSLTIDWSGATNDILTLTAV
jgi:hypothetical protein